MQVKSLLLAFLPTPQVWACDVVMRCLVWYSGKAMLFVEGLGDNARQQA